MAIDGRYDGDLSFSLLQLDRDCNLLDQRRFRWSNIGNEDDIRYVAGFDIVANCESRRGEDGILASWDQGIEKKGLSLGA